MKFSYPKLQFGIRFLLLVGILAPLLLVMRVPEIDNVWLGVFGIIFFIAISLVTLTPMLTRHEITDEGIILRQGLLFKSAFRFKEIETMELFQPRSWAFSLFQADAKGKIVLASGNRNLVKIKLRNKRRFGLLLWRSSKEIIFDVNKPEDFVKLANEMLAR